MTGSQILIRLFKDSIKPYTVRLFSSLFFMVIIALSTGATAWLLDPAIDKIFLDKDESMLLLIPIAIILTLFIKSIATYIQIILLNGVAQNIIADTQIKLFKKIISISNLNNFIFRDFIKVFRYHALISSFGHSLS